MMIQGLKVSQYNYMVETESEIIIYNTLYRSKIRVTKHEWGDLKEIFKGNFLLQNQEKIKVLTTLKLLVPEGENELNLVKRRKKAGMNNPNILDLIILPTLDCNFSCPYCFENKVSKSSMSSSTVEKISSFLSKSIPKYRFVNVQWFGGEPLLGIKSVLTLSNEIKRICLAEKVEFNFAMTTNGFLLSPETSSSLIEAGISSFQITIDGMPETHNKLRPLRNGKESFETIFKNLLSILENYPEVTIQLRINFNSSNAESMYGFLLMVPQQYRKQVKVTAQPIFGDTPFAASKHLTTESIANHYTEMEKKALEFGYKWIKPYYQDMIQMINCYAEKEHQLILNYNGDVFKCSAGSFEQADRFGLLGNDGQLIKNELWKNWMNTEFPEYCEPCIFLPECMGGCRNRKELGKRADCELIFKSEIEQTLKQERR